MPPRLDPTTKLTARIFTDDLSLIRDVARARNEDFTALIRDILRLHCNRIREQIHDHAA